MALYYELKLHIKINDKKEVLKWRGVVEFNKRMQKFGNDCTLILYKGRNHGFFNYGRSEDNKDYLDTLRRTEKFLQEKGYL